MKADVKWSSFVPERFIEEKNIVVVLGAAQGLVFHHPEATWCLTQVWIFNTNNMVIETQDRWCVSNFDHDKVFGKVRSKREQKENQDKRTERKERNRSKRKSREATREFRDAKAELRKTKRKK
jgi:hypothetical protein